jgi:hypothetical protein
VIEAGGEAGFVVAVSSRLECAGPVFRDGLEPENPRMTRLVSCVALLALSLSLLGCQKSTPPPPATPAAPAATVKAGDLLKEYGSNAAAADGKYKDKNIQVSGKAGPVQKVPVVGTYVVTVYGEDSGDLGMSGIQAFMAESATGDVAKLKEGQAITLQGTCDGGAVGQVKLSKCTIVNK